MVSSLGMFNKVGTLANNTLQLSIKEVIDALDNKDKRLTDYDRDRLMFVQPGDRVKLSDGWTYSICKNAYIYDV